MVRSEVLAFSDPLAYQTAIRAGVADVLVTSRGLFHAELTKVGRGRVWMQQGFDNLGRIIRGDVDTASRASVLFLAGADDPPMQHSGTDLSHGKLVV